MTPRRSSIIFGLTTAFVATAALAFAPGGGFELVSSSIDGGGGLSSGADYVLAGAIGQPDAGAMSGGDFTLGGGLWPATTTACPGDTDGNGAIDVDDLVAVILDWGSDGSANNGDVDGSGLVDVDDLVEVILNWGVCA